MLVTRSPAPAEPLNTGRELCGRQTKDPGAPGGKQPLPPNALPAPPTPFPLSFPQGRRHLVKRNLRYLAERQALSSTEDLPYTRMACGVLGCISRTFPCNNHIASHLALLPRHVSVHSSSPPPPPPPPCLSDAWPREIANKKQIKEHQKNTPTREGRHQTRRKSSSREEKIKQLQTKTRVEK